MPDRPHRPSFFSVLSVVGSAIVALALAFWAYGSAPLPQGLSAVNGRIEGDPVVVAAKVSGRLIALHVKEGDAVEDGQLLAEISAEQIAARVDQAVAGSGVALGVIGGAKAVAQGARSHLRRAEAMRTAAVARRGKVAADARRAEQLFAQGVIAHAQLDGARASDDVAAAEVQAAEEDVAAAQRAIEAADAQVASAEMQLQAAHAVLAESRATLGDTQVRSPSGGVVTLKVAEQGEVLTAGAPIVVVTDLDRLHMKAYAPEPEIGRIKIGDEAQVYADAFPEKPFSATVREIASESEFTPKEVQTREERVKQVIAVKLYLDANPEHRLVPGMPADAFIRWQPGAAWMDARR